MGIGYSELCFTTDVFDPMEEQDIKTLPLRTWPMTPFVRHGPSNYECNTCHQFFKTQDNVESHFWCYTEKELNQLIKKTVQEFEKTDYIN